MSDTEFEIVDSYLTPIEASFQENRSQLKVVNYGTGLGKSYAFFQAAYETIKQHPDVRILVFYAAPLREHLTIDPGLKNRYFDIPAFTINSREMKTTDEYLRAYKDWIRKILGNKQLWQTLPRELVEKTQEQRRRFEQVPEIIRQIENFKRAIMEEAERDKWIKKNIDLLCSRIETFLQFFIRERPDEAAWPEEVLRLVEIFFPLYLLREKSGILLLTCQKFETTLPVFHFDGNVWIRRDRRIPAYIGQQQDPGVKFILAFDELEDGYQIMLDEMIDIISPQALAINNALSSINRELSVLFSRHGKDNRKLLEFVVQNSGAFHEFEEHATRNKMIAPRLMELFPLYERLVAREGNSIQFLRELAKINRQLEESLQDIAQVFEQYQEEKPVNFDFTILDKVLSRFQNNRSLLIPYELYQEIGDDLINIFSYNNVYIYNIEPLKKLFLTRSASGHVIITRRKTPGHNTSMAELIYAILAVRLQIQTIKQFLAHVLTAEDSQSRSLDVWSRQASKVQRAIEEHAPQTPRKSDYLDRAYVYESYKSIINIMEITRYQTPENNLVAPDQREVSIGSTAIMTSPENTLLSMLARPGTVIFLISATGGIFGDLSTSYDMKYLKDMLRDESGVSSFQKMNEREILLCEQIRSQRQSARRVEAAIFDKEWESFPNIKTRDVAQRFEEGPLTSFIEGLAANNIWLGIYKVQELKHFCRFLFYLMEDDEIQDMVIFTQRISWIHSLLENCEAKHYQPRFSFKVSPDHPDIFYIGVDHPKYQSPVEVKVIFYSADFNRRYGDKEGKGNYLRELRQQKGQKILFISAYASASKGLNPVIISETDEKDFDSLVLLMDSYYSVMKPEPARKKISSTAGNPKTKIHFALMKGIVQKGELIEIRKFNEYLRRPEAQAFWNRQHLILLAKTAMQAIGRAERRKLSGQVVKIFINQETQFNLLAFYRDLQEKEPDEIRKLSVNNHAVYRRIQEEERKRLIPNYEEHLETEIEATLAFYRFRKHLLDEIERFHRDPSAWAVTQTWEALRDPRALSDPRAYLEYLRQSRLFPDDFIESLFYYNPDRPGFIPYLATEIIEGKKFRILSDSLNGKAPYMYQARLYPDYLKVASKEVDEEGRPLRLVNPSTDLIYKYYNKLVPQPEIFTTYIPRPHFFYDVLYPALAEHFVDHWIKGVIFQGKDWKAIKTEYKIEPVRNFKKYNNLYERFDLYYLYGEQELLGVDVKAWSRASGDRLSKETRQKAQGKLVTIESSYPEFKAVRGLLLNLHSPQEKSISHSPALSSGSLIYSDEEYRPVESQILWQFLFPRSKR